MLEKLVEEIFPLVKACFLAGEANEGQYPEAQLDRGMKTIIVEIITHTGKAYVDGLPLPDEVGRWYFVGERWPPRYWTAEPRGVKGEKTIIALCKGEEK